MGTAPAGRRTGFSLFPTPPRLPAPFQEFVPPRSQNTKSLIPRFSSRRDAPSSPPRTLVPPRPAAPFPPLHGSPLLRVPSSPLTSHEHRAKEYSCRNRAGSPCTKTVVLARDPGGWSGGGGRGGILIGSASPQHRERDSVVFAPHLTSGLLHLPPSRASSASETEAPPHPHLICCSPPLPSAYMDV